MTPSTGSDRRWWTIDPLNGEPIEVALAEEVQRHDTAAYRAELQVDIMREAASRMRLLLRRATVEASTTDRAEAREELVDAIRWLAAGAPDESAEAVA